MFFLVVYVQFHSFCVPLLAVLYNMFACLFFCSCSFFMWFLLLVFSGCCMPACICEGHSSVASTHRERDQKFYMANNASQQLQQPAKSKPKRSSSGSSSNGSNEKPPQLPPRDTSIYSQDPTVSSVVVLIKGSLGL